MHLLFFSVLVSRGRASSVYELLRSVCPQKCNKGKPQGCWTERPFPAEWVPEYLYFPLKHTPVMLDTVGISGLLFHICRSLHYCWLLFLSMGKVCHNWLDCCCCRRSSHCGECPAAVYVQPGPVCLPVDPLQVGKSSTAIVRGKREVIKGLPRPRIQLKTPAYCTKHAAKRCFQRRSPIYTVHGNELEYWYYFYKWRH